jgi:hypothetical protein
MQGLRIIFLFDRNRLRTIRCLVRSADEQVAAADFIARIASAVQPDALSTVSTGVEAGNSRR